MLPRSQRCSSLLPSSRSLSTHSSGRGRTSTTTTPATSSGSHSTNGEAPDLRQFGALARLSATQRVVIALEGAGDTRP